MKVYRCEQGTDEWQSCRLGVPTASRFDQILTAGGKPSASAKAYRRELIAERATGANEGITQTDWMLRGIELESAARLWYEALHGDVDQVGFVLSDDGYGCSPDGLMGDNGLLEIKCPKPSTHVGYVLDRKLPTKYKPQVQGQMLVCNRNWCDFLSYLPGAAPMVIRVERDEAYTALLHAALCDFVGELEREFEAYMEKAQ